MRSSGGDMKTTIQLSEMHAHPMLQIYQKPIVTLKKYRKELEDTDHMVTQFITNQRGKVDLNKGVEGINVYV